VNLTRSLAARLLGVPFTPSDAPVLQRGPARRVPSTGPFSVLIWNIQFSGSRDLHFFYDGGRAVRVPEPQVRRTLAGIAAAVLDADADVVLLQEVDRGSDRTARVDLHRELLDRLPHPAATTAPYHRVPYVPYPAHAHLGRVDMNLAAYSRFAIRRATRVPLPTLAEPAWRRAFNLRRCAQVLHLPTDDGREISLIHTHLSAFSRGDGTLGRQVAALLGLVDDAEGAGRPWLLAGDLNSLPPGDDPARLPPAEAALYADGPTPIAPLFARGAHPDPAQLDDPAGGTYQPFGAAGPDRTLDYAFAGPGLRPLSYAVLREHGAWSDHLPIRVELRLEPA
jgi:endonuclease/exonuclease/phosphatase family metal-dependent hydrolase